MRCVCASRPPVRPSVRPAAPAPQCVRQRASLAAAPLGSHPSAPSAAALQQAGRSRPKGLAGSQPAGQAWRLSAGKRQLRRRRREDPAWLCVACAAACACAPAPKLRQHTRVQSPKSLAATSCAPMCVPAGRPLKSRPPALRTSGPLGALNGECSDRGARGGAQRHSGRPPSAPSVWPRAAPPGGRPARHSGRDSAGHLRPKLILICSAA